MLRYPLILASESPRRSDLLRQVGLKFVVEKSEAEELQEGLPLEIVCENAKRKAEHVFASHPQSIVLGADTVVALQDAVFGKPRDDEDARRMLRVLSGAWHEVYTGVTVCSPNGTITRADRTRVHMVSLSDVEIDAYIQTGEPFGKAGAYAIQGIAGQLIDRIEGSASNVIGLPLSMVRDVFAELKV